MAELSESRAFTAPEPGEDWAALAARVLPGTPEGEAVEKLQSWNLHLFARHPRGQFLGSDVVFTAPAGGVSETPFIEAAEIAPGHDGAAELVLFVRYPGAGRQTVTLDADAAEVLFEHTQTGDVSALHGVPWHHLKDVLQQRPGSGAAGGNS